MATSGIFTRSISVGGGARDSVWYRRGFKSAFDTGKFERLSEIEELSEGILAVLYGECPLCIEETNNPRRLDFLPNY